MAEVNNIITDPNKDATDAFVQTKSEVSGVGGSSPITAAMKLKMIQDDPAFGYPKVRTIDEQAKNYYTKIMNDDELRDASMKATSNANDVSGTYTRVSNALKLAVYDRVNRPDMLEMSRGYTLMTASKPGEEDFTVGKALVQEAKKSLDSKLDDLVLETRPGDMNLEWYEKMPESLASGAISVGEMVAVGAIPVVGVPAAAALMGTDVYSQGVQADIDAYIKKTGDTELKDFQPKSKDALINGVSAIAQGALEATTFGAAGLVGRVAGKAGNVAVKTAAKEAISGFVQETTQAITGNLAEVAKGNQNWNDFRDGLGDVLSQGITGAILQGSMGYGIAHATRNKAITQTTEFFGKVNTQENLGKTDAEVKEQAIQFVDEQLDNGMRATTQELIDRSGLNQDRGDLRDKVVSTLKQAYMDSEEFKDMSEEKQAQVIESAATIESANMIYDAVEKGIPVAESPYKKMQSTEVGIFLTGIENFDEQTQAKIEEINQNIREIKAELEKARQENDIDKIDNMERRLQIARKDALSELNQFRQQQTADDLLASRIADMAEKVKAQRESRETKQQTAEAKVREKTDRNTFRNLLRKIETSKIVSSAKIINQIKNSDREILEKFVKSIYGYNTRNFADSTLKELALAQKSKWKYELKVKKNLTEKEEVVAAEKTKITQQRTITKIITQDMRDLSSFTGIPESVIEKMSDEEYKEFYDNALAKQSEINAQIHTDNLPDIDFQSDIKADINSPEFKKWFGDSKVVDENGNPLVVYHGTGGKFDTFDINKSSNAYASSKGFFFANKEIAENYGNIENIGGVYLSLQNPEIIDVRHELSQLDYDVFGDEMQDAIDAGYPIKRWLGEDIVEMEANDSATAYIDDNYSLVQEAKENGKDGVIVNGVDGSNVYIAFEPNQIKSINNEGTFSKETGNIYNQSNTTGKKADNYRGAYLDKYELVQLGNLADETSFGHEMAHHWANNNFKWLRDGNPSESFKAMWGAVESWLGVRPEQTKLSSAQSEKFARGYESWITSRKITNVGDADKKELEKAFDNFTDWSLDIYDSVESQYFDQVGKIPESVSGWFNKIQEGFTPTKLEQAGIINKETADVLKVQDNAAQVIDTGVKESQKSVESSDKTAEKATETESAIPSVDNLLPVPEKSEEFNTGKEKQSESAKNFEKRTGIEQESKYNQHELDKARESARALIDKDENLAWSILQGEKPEQGGIFKQDLLVAMEEKLKEDNDIDGLIKLAPLVKEIGMESGQKLSALKGRTEFAFTDAINLIDKMAKTGKTKKEIESQVKEYQKEIDEVAFNWVESKDEDFFNTMECQ